MVRLPRPGFGAGKPQGVACYAIAATAKAGKGRVAAVLPDDGLVPLESALGRHRKPELALDFREERTWVATDTGHFDLLCRPAVYACLRDWLNPVGPASAVRQRRISA